ncbi:MAG: hypothetical protein WA555_16255 [Candidatus Sulfotelmatobacter sp.]
MRHYIKTITHENNHDNFVFTRVIEGGWNWSTEEEAERYRRWTVACGETVSHSPLRRVSGVCTGFRVERRPQGGFVISCETGLD